MFPAILADGLSRGGLHRPRYKTFVTLSIVIPTSVGWLATRSHMPTSTEGNLRYSRRSIGEFHCAPPGPGSLPAVIMLHGAAIRGTADDQFHSMCAALADRGYFGEFLEYYDATDNTDSTTDQTEDFNAWFAAIHASIEALAKNPAVDPKRIAVMGFPRAPTWPLDVARCSRIRSPPSSNTTVA